MPTPEVLCANNSDVGNTITSSSTFWVTYCGAMNLKEICASGNLDPTPSWPANHRVKDFFDACDKIPGIEKDFKDSAVAQDAKKNDAYKIYALFITKNIIVKVTDSAAESKIHNLKRSFTGPTYLLSEEIRPLKEVAKKRPVNAFSAPLSSGYAALLFGKWVVVPEGYGVFNPLQMTCLLPPSPSCIDMDPRLGPTARDKSRSLSSVSP